MIHAIDRVNETKPTVLLIMGSTRAGRLCPLITEWVAGIGRSCGDFNIEIVDLADWPLPMDDEPGIPALGHYLQPHTRAWSSKVASATAVVLVTPQYNWGYPAVLKNALDHLYAEWKGKPAAVVSYGGHGGGKCTRQLRQVAAGLKMRMVATSPKLVLADAVIRQGVPVTPEVDFSARGKAVRRMFEELALVAGVGRADHRLPYFRRIFSRFAG